MGILEKVKLLFYICNMKSSVEVIIVMFTLVFGLSMFNWMLNFTPSFNQITEVEIVREEEEE
jgi:hypothetical protein